MPMPRTGTHEFRTVTGRAFTLHLRCFGKVISKTNEFLRNYRREVEDIFFDLTGERFDRRLGITGMAGRIMRSESSRLEGVQAHAREVKVCAKYLGLIRPENMLTKQGEKYLDTLERGDDYKTLLQDYFNKIKIMCPLIRTYFYQPGHKQAGYANYRIRPVIMTLYAISKGREMGMDVNTDDIALTALLFYPPDKQERVTEDFLINRINDYFARKSSGDINYEEQFRNLYSELLSETGAQPNEDEFRQKVRNSANNVWCFLIALRDIGFVEAVDDDPSHWSSTAIVPESSRTFPVSYQILSLTDQGREALRIAFQYNPIWYEDICNQVGTVQGRNRIVNAIELLRLNGRLLENEVDSTLL